MGPPTAETLQSHRITESVKDARGREYHEKLVKLQKALDSLSSDELACILSKTKADSLDILHPYLDTLPYLYILQARISLVKHSVKNLAASLRPGGDLYQKLYLFLTQLDPVAARYGGAKWRYLMDIMGNIAIGGGEPYVVLSDMGLAMARLDPSVGTLTTLHLHFVRLCLETGVYIAASSFLDKDIHSFPVKSAATEDSYYVTEGTLSNSFMDKSSGFTDTLNLAMILEYYLLGAMAYIGMGSWAKAIYYLEHVLSVPTTSGSANYVMLEAYRKWVLCNLLAKGHLSSSGTTAVKTANSQSLRVLRNASKHYEAVASAFALPDPSKMNAEIDLGGELWAEDGNLGLLQKVVQRHRELSVRQLQNVYTALPIPVVAAKQGIPPEQVEEYLDGLIREGLLNATIERSPDKSRPPILRFSQDTKSGAQNAKTEQELCDELVNQTVKMKALAEHINEADRRLALSKEYIDHANKIKRQREMRSSVGGPDDEETLGMLGGGGGTRSSDEDEDMLDA